MVLEQLTKMKGAEMSSNRLSKLAVVFALALMFGLSNFVIAQEKMDKKISKDLKQTTLKISGID
jgi:hypothetical protein